MGQRIGVKWLNEFCRFGRDLAAMIAAMIAPLTDESIVRRRVKCIRIAVMQIRR